VDRRPANRPLVGAWQDDLVRFAFRAASAADVDDLIALWEEAAENGNRPPDTAGAVTALLGRDPQAVILAEQDGVLIGSVIAGWDGWRYHLYRLAVRPNWRRQGVGSALLGAAESRLKALGATRIDAMVLDGNDLGQNLWRASGYSRQDDWRRWVKTL
jgi:ribosomal protein S18 acetylase RimI-like enzyme